MSKSETVSRNRYNLCLIVLGMLLVSFLYTLQDMDKYTRQRERILSQRIAALEDAVRWGGADINTPQKVEENQTVTFGGETE